ncbi:MAG: Fic family protein [Ignavibacteriae bacterium]|nr:Fic family protein [Ignavibacteriota bacterium]
MRKLEKAPDWSSDKSFSRGAELWSSYKFTKLLNDLNDKYFYWDKIKYQRLPKSLTSKELWILTKMKRSFDAKEIEFGKYKFQFNITDLIQEQLHQFDLNIGGNLESKSLIPENDKQRYLISSIMEEAIASSQLEGAITTRKKAKEMLRKDKKPKNISEQMIVNNYTTIKHIVNNKEQKLTKETLLNIHKLVTSKTLDNPKDQGRFRLDNETKVVDPMDGEVHHIPPDFKELNVLIKDLCKFFNDEKDKYFIHPIIKASIIHFMVGYIHPFVDGNGRTARALFYWYLLSKGYWLTEFLSISKLIVKTRTQYARAFQYSEIDDNDITYFINYNLKVMDSAFEDLKKYIKRKINEKKKIVEFQKIKSVNERQALMLKWLYEEPNLLFTVKEIETRLSVSNQTARTDLLTLVEKGFLELVLLNKRKQAFGKGKKFDQLISKLKNI